MTKNKKPLMIILTLIIIIGVYLAINHKEVRQAFMDGFNDGNAEKAKEEPTK